MNKLIAWGAAGALALGLAGNAQASNVYWSISVHQPGVHVGVTHTPAWVVQYPVVVTPPPRHGWGALGRGHGHHKWRDGPRHPKVTQVIHHHHYHGAPPMHPHRR